MFLQRDAAKKKLSSIRIRIKQAAASKSAYDSLKSSYDEISFEGSGDT